MALAVSGEVFLGDAEALADDLGQRPERDTLAVGQAAATVPPHFCGHAVNVLLELPAHPGLAHPGRSRDQHHARYLPLSHNMEQVPDRAQLGVPPGQCRLQAVNPLGTPHPRQHPGRAPQPDRLRLAFHPAVPGLGESDPAARQPMRGPVREHLPRLRGRLDPGRGVHRVPGHHPLPHRAQGHRHLAGDHARPGSQPRHADDGAQLTNRVHEVKPCADRPFCVAFGGGRRSPHGHHRVPDELLHHPAVTLDHRPGHAEVLREQLPHRFRVAGLRQGGEPDHVAEQHRAHPALGHSLTASHRARLGS